MIVVSARRDTSDMLLVQQLNHAQWHVIDTAGNWGSGVSSWVDAVSSALWAALLTNRGIESVGLDGNRLLLLRAGCSA